MFGHRIVYLFAIYAQMQIVVNFVPDFFVFSKFCLLIFLGLLLGIKAPDRFRKLRENISWRTVPITSKMARRRPKYEGKTVLKKLNLTTIKATTIYM